MDTPTMPSNLPIISANGGAEPSSTSAMRSIFSSTTPCMAGVAPPPAPAAGQRPRDPLDRRLRWARLLEHVLADVEKAFQLPIAHALGEFVPLLEDRRWARVARFHAHQFIHGFFLLARLGVHE